MKRLYDYIKEAISDDIKQQLLAIITNPNFTDRQAKRMIRSVEDPKILVDLLYGYFEQRGCEDDSKNIARIIDANDNLEEFLNIVGDLSILPTTDQFLKSDNVYKLFASLNLNRDTIAELAKENPSKNSITRGAFEILFELLLQDVNKGNANYPGKSGDVNAGGLALEFKGPGARVKSQVEHSASAIDSKFNELYKVVNNDINNVKAVFSSQTSMRQYFEDLKITDDEIFDIIAQSLLAQYNLSDTVKDLKPLQKDIVKNGVVDYKNVTKLMGSIQLKGYVEDEHWDYMVVFKGKKGEQAIKTGDYAIISAEDAKDIKKIFNDKHITFSGGGHAYRSVRDHYCQINYN